LPAKTSASRTGPFSPSRVVGHLDHRQSPTLRGDRVEFSGRGLLPGTQCLGAAAQPLMPPLLGEPGAWLPPKVAMLVALC